MSDHEANTRVREILRGICAGNSSRAAAAIAEEFIFIHKTETCDSEVQEDELGVAVTAGSGPEFAVGSTTDNPNWLRNKALNLLRIADYVENRESIIASKKAEAKAVLDKRRDELSKGYLLTGYSNLRDDAQKLIDRVIELEGPAK